MAEKEQLAPYDLLKPGWEGVYTGEKSDTPDDSTDDKGNVISQWSTWPFTDVGADWAQWGDEAQHINHMQKALGTLSEEARRIRIHMGGLVLCDSGVPVSIDELLNTIGSGVLPKKHSGLAAGPEGKAEPLDLITVRVCKLSNPFCAGILLAILRNTLSRSSLMQQALCDESTTG